MNNKVKDDSTPIKSAKQKIVSEGGDRNNNAVEDLGEGVEEIDTNKENKTIMCGNYMYIFHVQTITLVLGLKNVSSLLPYLP